MHRGILIFGYPGSGKGTQAKALCTLPGFHHVAMGDIFRGLKDEHPLYGEVQRYLVAGDLVPDDLVVKMFGHHLESRRIPPEEFLIIDGIPRNTNQVALVAKYVEVIKIIKLSVYDESVILRRLLGRAQKENRPDDTREVIQHRLDVYRQQTESCISAYPGTMLTRVQGDQSVFEVHLDIVNSLHKIPGVRFP